MLIGSAMPHVAPSPSTLPARPLSPETSPDLARANQAPVTAVQAQADPGKPSVREEVDRPLDDAQQEARGEPRGQQPQEQRIIDGLVSRDREVRLHEQAHASVGGAYAGAPSYSFKRGPDGRSYAVGGEVSIDASPVANDPAATLRKMEVVLRAALAPAEPSAQDLRVAAQAQAQAAQARADLAELQREATAVTESAEETEAKQEQGAEASAAKPSGTATAADLDLYRLLAEPPASAQGVDLVA